MRGIGWLVIAQWRQALRWPVGRRPLAHISLIWHEPSAVRSARQPHARVNLRSASKPGLISLIGAALAQRPMERNFKCGVSGLRGDVSFSPQGQFQAYSIEVGGAL